MTERQIQRPDPRMPRCAGEKTGRAQRSRENRPKPRILFDALKATSYPNSQYTLEDETRNQRRHKEQDNPVPLHPGEADLAGRIVDCDRLDRTIIRQCRLARSEDAFPEISFSRTGETRASLAIPQLVSRLSARRQRSDLVLTFTLRHDAPHYFPVFRNMHGRSRTKFRRQLQRSVVQCCWILDSRLHQKVCAGCSGIQPKYLSN